MLPKPMRLLLLVLLFVVPVLGYLTAATSVTEVATLFRVFIPISHLVGPDAGWSSVVTTLHRVLAIMLVLLAVWHAIVAAHNHSRRSAI